jgi:hypothetical protein
VSLFAVAKHRRKHFRAVNNKLEFDGVDRRGDAAQMTLRSDLPIRVLKTTVSRVVMALGSDAFEAGRVRCAPAPVVSAYLRVRAERSLHGNTHRWTVVKILRCDDREAAQIAQSQI